jgi:hypothetical protein
MKLATLYKFGHGNITKEDLRHLCQYKEFTLVMHVRNITVTVLLRHQYLEMYSCKYRYCMFFAFQVFRLCNNNINITLHILIGCCAAIKLIENKHGLETRQKSLCYVLVHVHTLEICALSQ